MKIKDRFCNLLGEENVLTDELMSSHTTFRIGGAADYFLLPTERTQIKGIFEICKEENIPCFILGNGSNLLVSDRGSVSYTHLDVYKRQSRRHTAAHIQRVFKTKINEPSCSQSGNGCEAFWGSKGRILFFLFFRRRTGA